MLLAMVFETPPATSIEPLREQLLLQLASGDLTAMQEIYTATSSAVYGFALSILKHASDAEDVMQETYVRLYRSAPTYQPMGKPMAWIFTIVRNLSLMKLRGNKPDVLPEDFELSDEGEPYRQAEDRLVLNAAMQVLSDEERQIITLHAVSGMKHREIADLMELPLSTVLSKYRRGLKKLQEHLKEGEI